MHRVMNIWSIFGLLACLAGVAFPQSVNHCGYQQTCKNILACPNLLNLLRTQGQNNKGVQDYLRRSVCGYERNNPKVCCPSNNNNGALNIGNISRGPQRITLPEKCGIPANYNFQRIIGGSPADLGQWPWMTALGYRAKRGNQGLIQWLCGGALITERHVITAAHCLLHPSLNLVKVRVGDLDLNDDIADGASPMEIDIEELISHEKYSKSKFTDDIAILKLADSVVFNNNIQPICLPRTPQLRADTFSGNNPFVAGWGSTQFKGPSSSHLQYIQLPVLDNSVCEQKFKPKGANIVRKQLCAGSVLGDKDSCQGDSGGPLMYPKGATFYLIGIVSFGFKCAEKGYPGVYTRVTEYIDWIETNIQK